MTVGNVVGDFVCKTYIVYTVLKTIESAGSTPVTNMTCPFVDLEMPIGGNYGMASSRKHVLYILSIESTVKGFCRQTGLLKRCRNP